MRCHKKKMRIIIIMNLKKLNTFQIERKNQPIIHNKSKILKIKQQYFYQEAQKLESQPCYIYYKEINQNPKKNNSFCLSQGLLLGCSFTKNFNVFSKKESEIIFIDTPGFYDTNDGYDEIISQINLAKMLNQCQQQQCRDMLFLVVAQHNESNYNELQDTIARLKENFSEQMITFFLQKLCLIISKSESEVDEMAESMEIIFKNIISSNRQFKNDPIIAHLQMHKEQILYFPKNANEKQQKQLQTEIFNFIERTQEDLSQSRLKFFLTISEKGFISLLKFLGIIKQFYLIELKESYDFLINQINEINDVIIKFRICKQIQNIQENPLHFNNIQSFLMNFNKVQESLNLQIRSQYRIRKAEALFEDGWVEAIFAFETQQKYFNQSYSLEMKQSYDKIINLSIKFAGELEQMYKQKNQIHSLFFHQMMEVTKRLQNLTAKEWDKLVVVVGSRKSGKSTAIKIIYDQYPQDCNLYQPIFFNEQDQFNPELLSILQFNENVIIEFQKLTIGSLPFLQYLYQLALDQQKQFQLFFIIDHKSKDDQDVPQALQKFIDLNNCENTLKIFIIANIKLGQTSPNNLNDYLPQYFKDAYAKRKQKIFKIFYQNNQYLIDQKNFETYTFDCQSEKRASFISDDSITLFKNFMSEIFFQIQQIIDLSQHKMWEKTQQIPEFENLLKLSQLQPNSANFEQKIKQQTLNFNINIIIFENRYDQLQELHKKLIEQRDLVKKIDDALVQVEKAKNFLQILCFQILFVYCYDLRLNIQALIEINKNFPIYLENELELSEKIKFLQVIADKLYPKVTHFSQISKLSKKQIEDVKKKLKQKHNKPNLDVLNLVLQLLQQINSEYIKLFQLLKLIQASQSENFKYIDRQFFVKIYFSFLSLFESNQYSQIQQQLSPMIKKYEDIKIYESLLQMI